MTNTNGNIDKIWVDNQIKKYKTIFPRYEKYSGTLQTLLQKIAKKQDTSAIVQTRPKSIASFGEKIVRKWPKYHDPLNELTDLCGGRIITHTQRQVKNISKFIEDHFIIDWENSVDIQQKLKPKKRSRYFLWKTWSDLSGIR